MSESCFTTASSLTFDSRKSPGVFPSPVSPTSLNTDYSEFLNAAENCLKLLRPTLRTFQHQIRSESPESKQEAIMQSVNIKHLLQVSHTTLEEVESLMISQISNRHGNTNRPPKEVDSVPDDERMNLTNYEFETIHAMDKDFIASLNHVLESQLDDEVSIEDMRYNIRHHLELCYSKSTHPFCRSVTAFIRNYFNIDLPLAGDGEKFKHLILVLRSFKRMHIHYVTKKAYKGLLNIVGARGIVLAVVEKYVVAPFYNKIYKYCVPVHYSDNIKVTDYMKGLLDTPLGDYGVREEYVNPKPQPPGAPHATEEHTYWRAGSRSNSTSSTSPTTHETPMSDPDESYKIDDELNGLIDFGFQSVPSSVRQHDLLPEIKDDLEERSPRVDECTNEPSPRVTGNNFLYETQGGEDPNSLEPLRNLTKFARPSLLNSPYQGAINHLQKVPQQRTAYAKIQCLTRACREICDVITAAFSEMKLRHVVCDDLIPIFSYCLVQSQIPYVMTEVNFISDLLDESCALGEAGYCFTTLECAIMLINQLGKDLDPLDSSQEERRFVGQELQRLSEQYRSEKILESFEGPSISGSHRPSLSSLPSSGLTVQTYDRIAEDAVRKLLNADDLDSSDGWTFQHQRNNVNVYLKDYVSTGVSCTKGIGIIKASPAILIDILKDSNNRRHYDEMFVSTRLIERVGDTTKIVRLCFRARNWCLTSKRDFCMLIHWRRLHDGTQILIGRSVGHEKCPTSPNYIRAKALGGGWIIRPIDGRPEETRVTYVAHVDLMGNVPTYLKNMINLNQPMLIDKLRTLFA